LLPIRHFAKVESFTLNSQERNLTLPKSRRKLESVRLNFELNQTDKPSAAGQKGPGI
jgi:hypothetical protein